MAGWDDVSVACRDLVEMVTTYLEGALEPVRARRFEAHIADCPGCAAHLLSTRRLLSMLRALPGDRTPPRVRQGLLHGFRAWRAGERPGPVAGVDR
jgi:anti-sigma factor RsiW